MKKLLALAAALFTAPLVFAQSPAPFQVALDAEGLAREYSAVQEAVFSLQPQRMVDGVNEITFPDHLLRWGGPAFQGGRIVIQILRGRGNGDAFSITYIFEARPNGPVVTRMIGSEETGYRSFTVDARTGALLEGEQGSPLPTAPEEQLLLEAYRVRHFVVQ